MNINIQSLHFTAKPELTDFITEKVNKLSALYDKIESAEVTLKLENSAENGNRICEIRLAVPGNDLFAKKQHETFEEATTEVVDALHTQLQKLKAKSEGR